MTCSSDLQMRVASFVQDGGSGLACWVSRHCIWNALHKMDELGKNRLVTKSAARCTEEGFCVLASDPFVMPADRLCR